MHSNHDEKPDLESRRSVIAYVLYCLSISLLVQLIGSLVTWPYDLYLIYAYLPLTTALVMPLLAHGVRLNSPADLARVAIGVVVQTIFISSIATTTSATDSIAGGGDAKLIISVALTIALSAWLSAYVVRRGYWPHFRMSRPRD
ncbi:TPA: hypothetical protein N2C61_003432 [Pseudomonas aeruginosa]|nr:hypothetical protein [Pseudomonas aeruginosa]